MTFIMFVLAHLSDPHLSPLPSPHWRELLSKRATGLLNWRRKRHLIHRTEVLARVVADLRASAPDHIAVTGDLVNISLAGEYPPARAWLESVGSPTEVSYVPGNHDAYVRGAARHFYAQWRDYMCGDENCEVEFPYLRRRGPLALIGLSSAVPTALFMATGRLGQAQLKRFPELLDRCRGERLFRVVLIHHPPVSKLRQHFKRLIDGARLRAVLERHGAELVLHGHDHVHSLIYLKGPQRPIPVLGVPSASQIARAEHGPAGYNLCRIEGEMDAWRCETFARDLAPDGEFMTKSRRLLPPDS
jgi:3',5'-cyclic AMP phosphodiesterase CpdA